MVNRTRSSSTASASSRPDTLLPTITTNPNELENDVAPIVMQSPNFRKHNRKRSSTIYVAPRQASPPTSEKTEVPDSARQRKLVSLFSGVGALAGAQVLTKLMTFLVNQTVLRFVDARDFGASSQLEFVGITVLSLARDAIRFASQRQTLEHSHADEYRVDGGPVHGTRSGTIQETVNLAYCSIAIGAPLAVAMTMFMLYAGDGSSIAIISAVMYGVASILELAAEPCFLISQLQVDLSGRARVEALSAIFRTMCTFFLIVFMNSPAIFAFAAGQLTFGLVYCISFYLQSIAVFRRDSFKLYLAKVWAPIGDAKIYLDPEISKRAMGMGAQTMLKYFLTESDRLLVSFMISLEQQGMYALASNYGSLLARLVLFPMEEALRALFSKSLPQKGCRAANTVSSSKASTAQLNTAPVKIEPLSPSSLPPVSQSLDPEEETNEELSAVHTALTVFTTTLRVYSYLGMAAWALGPSIAPFLLSLVVNSRWAATGAADVLAVYMVYIPFLAVNGALEAFVQSTASLQDLRQQSMFMIVIAVLFVVFSYIFMSVLDLGAVGLVWAQVVSMSLRILWALYYAREYFATETNVGRWIPLALPSPIPVGFIAVVAGAAYKQGIVETFTEFLFSCALAVAFVLVTLYSERRSLRTLLQSVKPKRTSASAQVVEKKLQ